MIGPVSLINLRAVEIQRGLLQVGFARGSQGGAHEIGKTTGFQFHHDLSAIDFHGARRDSELERDRLIR